MIHVILHVHASGMRLKLYLFIIVVVCLLPAGGYAQEVDSLRHKLDSMAKREKRKIDRPVTDVDKDLYTQQTNITPKAYVILLGTDLVQQATGPFHTSGKTYLKVGAFVVLETALLFADMPIQKTAIKLMDSNPGLKDISEYITNFGGAWEAYTLAAFGAYGIIFKSNKVKTTTLLATQSYIAAGAVSSVTKYLTGRIRPHTSPGDNLVFVGPGKTSLGTSFPSGHTTAAFSAATVFACEYKDQLLIPVIAYTAATLVGLSRITENAHWATDVFAGAALGYVTGKQVVRNYHRYARLQNSKKKTALLFNLQYYDGIIMPGLVYKF
jgi:membrane-associated phospholipid phosphatase